MGAAGPAQKRLTRNNACAALLLRQRHLRRGLAGLADAVGRGGLGERLQRAALIQRVQAALRYRDRHSERGPAWNREAVLTELVAVVLPHEGQVSGTRARHVRRAA